MIRSAPPAPFKTAVLTLLIAVVIAFLAAGKADARDANWKVFVTIEAESKLPDPLQVDIDVPPGKLTGHAPKLLFHRTQKFTASAHDESRRSTAGAELTYTVKLVHR